MGKRKWINRKEVKKFWQDYLVGIGKFDSIDEFMEDDYCFACGFEGPTEKCHIVAHVEGGSERPENIHLLCHGCHKQSEYLAGDEYFEWLKNQNLLSASLTWLSLSPYAHKMQNIVSMIGDLSNRRNIQEVELVK